MGLRSVFSRLKHTLFPRPKWRNAYPVWALLIYEGQLDSKRSKYRGKAVLLSEGEVHTLDKRGRSINIVRLQEGDRAFVEDGKDLFIFKDGRLRFEREFKLSEFKISCSWEDDFALFGTIDGDLTKFHYSKLN